MKAEVEIYKGIEFVRRSSLPKDQKKLIWNSACRKKMIKILCDNKLLTDCIPYSLYLLWYQETYCLNIKINPAPHQDVEKLNLAFK
jgi:hypothetical protein